MIRHDWTLEELRKLYELPVLELIFQAASVHRQIHNVSHLQLCHLISVKTGGCSEDCKYCAQSSRYNTYVKPEKMMEVEDVLERAKSAKEKGATRICMGAGWRQLRDSIQFEKILEMVSKIRKMGLEVCCSLGMLNEEQAKRLKEAGLYAYNHNLDTSEKYYKEIITTRTYQDRLETLERVREAGITVCCGGIIGMGETLEDRLLLIQKLSSFQPHPESVPINRLVPIKGTPLGELKEVSIWEFVKMIAIARITMPKSMVRMAAGRLNLSDTEQSLCFLAGANSIFVGEKLLTAPNQPVDRDTKLLELLNLQPKPASQNNFLKDKLEKRTQFRRGLPKQCQDLVDLTSNDYLGFARSKELSDKIEIEYQSLNKKNRMGPHIGATGSRLLTGNRDYIEQLETEIATFHEAESCLLFNSGYAANLGLLSTVADSEDCYIIDSHVHASTWDGVKLSGAKTLLFRHNDLNHLEKQLKKGATYRRCFVCVESLYSMEGDLAPLKEISVLVQKASAHLIVDEAHATGIFGPQGRGCVVQEGIPVFARICTFGKALGIHGAAVLGSQTLRDTLINFSKPFIYTTALPLHSYVAIRTIYQQLENADPERAALQRLITYFGKNPSPIQSIQAKDVDGLSEELRQAGLDVRPIHPPTVRKGKECLRVCLHAFNTEEEIDRLFEVLSHKKELVSA